MVGAAGAGLRARITRRKNVNERRELLRLPVVFLGLHAVVILDGHAVGMVLNRHADLGQLLAIVGQQSGEVGGGQAYFGGHAPAERVRVTGPADERSHSRGMVRGRPRKAPRSHHATREVDIERVEGLLFHRHREALPGQLRKAESRR